MLNLAVGDELADDRPDRVGRIANPTPSDPPDSLSIWASTPIDPSLVDERPTQFPWLIAASVWIVSVIV